MRRDPKMELLAAYRKGWKNGATSAHRLKADSAAVDVEYQQGYEDGVKARIAADKKATARLGISQDDLMKAVLR